MIFRKYCSSHPAFKRLVLTPTLAVFSLFIKFNATCLMVLKLAALLPTLAREWSSSNDYNTPHILDHS